MKLTAKAFAVWAFILVCAVINGWLREAILVPQFGNRTGLLVSGLMLSALILAVAYIAEPWMAANRLPLLIGVGLGWAVLTVAFELSFGRFQGKPWPTLLEAYTFKDGNLWPLVLLVTAVAPYIAGRLRGVPWGSV